MNSNQPFFRRLASQLHELRQLPAAGIGLLLLAVGSQSATAQIYQPPTVVFRSTDVAVAAPAPMASEVVVQRPVYSSQASTTVYANPTVVQSTPVTTYQPVTTYYPPVTTYQPVTAYQPVAPLPATTVYSPMTGNQVYTTYSPVVPVTTTMRPVIVSPKVYIPGQPIRNVLRAITP